MLTVIAEIRTRLANIIAGLYWTSSQKSFQWYCRKKVVTVMRRWWIMRQALVFRLSHQIPS